MTSRRSNRPPIIRDSAARAGSVFPRTLLIFTRASRIAFNLSGIYPMPPLGVAYLASYLRKQGYEGTAVLDMPAFNLTASSAGPVLESEPFDIYGLSATLFGLAEVAALSSIIKTEVNPGATVVLGGPAAGFDTETLFERLPYVDLVVRGEGEVPLAGIVGRVKESRVITGVPGTAWRCGDGRIGRLELPHLEKPVFAGAPARDLLPVERYRIHPPFGVYPPATTVETQRGCSYDCNFCSISRRVSARAADDVVDELRMLAGDGYREAHFVDPTFPQDRERTVGLCEALLSAGIGLRWTCKSRVDTVDAELLGLMARSGCYMISFGIESGSDRILGGLNKGASAERARQTLRDCRAAGIRALSYILVGAPGETDETMRETVRLLVDERVAFALFGELLPDPDAPIFNNNGHAGREIRNAMTRYFFEDDAAALADIGVAGVSRSRVRGWLSWANRAFYLRPAYLAQRLLELKNINELFILANGFFQLAMEALRFRRMSAPARRRGRSRVSLPSRETGAVRSVRMK